MPGFWQRRTATQIRNINTNVFSTVRWYVTAKQIYFLSGNPIGSSPGTQNINISSLLEDPTTAQFVFVYLWTKAKPDGATENDRHSTWRLVHPVTVGMYPALEAHGNTALTVALGADLRESVFPLPLNGSSIIQLVGSCTTAFHGEFGAQLIGEAF